MMVGIAKRILPINAKEVPQPALIAVTLKEEMSEDLIKVGVFLQKTCQRGKDSAQKKASHVAFPT